MIGARLVGSAPQIASMPISIAKERQSSISRLVFRNAAAIGLARASSIVLDGFAFVLVTRYLGPVDYGHYVAILAFLGLIDSAADMTVLDIIVREMSKEPDRTGIWLGTGTVLRTALAALGFLAYSVYVYLGRTGAMSGLVGTAWIACLILPVGALRTPLAVFRAQMKMHFELGIILLTRLVNLALFLAVIHFHGQIYHFFIAVVASRTLLAVLSWTAALVLFRLRVLFRWDFFCYLIRESIPMGLSGLFVAVQLKVDILMMSVMVGAAAAGLYAVVAQLPEYFLYIPVIISTPMLPLLSRSFAESAVGRFQRLYQNLFDVVMAIVIPIGVVAFVMPRQLVTFLFGNRFAGAAHVLPLLILSVIFMWFSHATAIAAVAAKLQGSFLWIQSICVAIYLLLNLVLIPRWSAMGAATARLAATIVAPVLTYYVVKRRVGFSLETQTLRRMLFAGCIMAVAVVFASRFTLVVAGAIGTVVYGVTLWATRTTSRTLGHAEGE